MCVIDRFDKEFLIEFWIDRPRSSDNSYIAFIDTVTSDSEASESVVDLLHRIKFIHLSTHHSGFVGDIAPGKSGEIGTKNTLARTSPKLCQKGDDRNPRLISHTTFAKNPLCPRRRHNACVADHLVIALDKGDIGNRFREFMDGIMTITEFLKIGLRQNFLVFYNGQNNFVDDVGGMLEQEKKIREKKEKRRTILQE